MKILFKKSKILGNKEKKKLEIKTDHSLLELIKEVLKNLKII